MEKQNNLADEVKAIVASIFSEKEEEAMRAQTEEILKASASTIEELTTALESKNTEYSELNKAVDQLTVSNTEMAQQIETMKAEKEDIQAQLAQALATLEGIEKDKVATARMSELEVEGVVRKDVEEQTTKVRLMTEEEFAAYKAELVSIKTDILNSIAEQAKKDADEKAASEAAALAAKEAEGSVEPMKVDPKEAAKAALNLEIASSDITSKYRALGAAMAKAMSKSE